MSKYVPPKTKGYSGRWIGRQNVVVRQAQEREAVKKKKNDKLDRDYLTVDRKDGAAGNQDHPIDAEETIYASRAATIAAPKVQLQSMLPELGDLNKYLSLQPTGENPTDAISLLRSAQDEGYFLREQRRETDAQLRNALNDAVEALRERLKDVPGIGSIDAAETENGLPVIAVYAVRGFGEAQFLLVPESEAAFPVHLAIPFELLPLRKERAQVFTPPQMPDPVIG